jgi:chromosome segregation ATPase
MIRAWDALVKLPPQLAGRISPMTTPHDLRRAWLGGYKRADVAATLSRSEIDREALQRELDAVTQRANAMQLEIRELHARIDGLRQSETSLSRSLDEMRERRDQMDRESRHRAQELVLEAESRAAMLKTEGLRQVGDLQGQVELLLGMRAGLTQAMQRLSEDLAGAMARLAASPATAIDYQPEDQLSRWDAERSSRNAP